MGECGGFFNKITSIQLSTGQCEEEEEKKETSIKDLFELLKTE